MAVRRPTSRRLAIAACVIAPGWLFFAVVEGRGSIDPVLLLRSLLLGFYWPSSEWDGLRAVCAALLAWEAAMLVAYILGKVPVWAFMAVAIPRVLLVAGIALQSV